MPFLRLQNSHLPLILLSSGGGEHGQALKNKKAKGVIQALICRTQGASS